MTRRIEGEARAAVIRAQAQARRLGQPFIGCEHLLYGMSGSADAVGDALRARGVTPERVHAQIARMAAGSTPGANWTPAHSKRSASTWTPYEPVSKPRSARAVSTIAPRSRGQAVSGSGPAASSSRAAT